MKYYQIRRLRAKFDGPVFNQVKQIVRGLCSKDEQEVVRAEKTLALFCYKEQAMIIRFLHGGDI